ncbi:MAG: hypothetical protein CVU71_01745 [Deltaproteobacteria bacterium HGW-Deltaproteobacteria-6]|jgi:ribosomal protein S18 acetylase RimI-like enzyme|nr:MAG: hypothetical protein CVU71_01745 [Deltaproteobacteria bacterium HGW-Deltaproteobacteria-6]
MTAEQISIAPATPADAPMFSKFIRMSGKLLAAIYDRRTESLLAHLYVQPDNLYSYTHSCFLQVDGKKAGLLLAYSQATAQNQQPGTNRLMIEYLRFGYYRRLFRMVKAGRALGPPAPDEYLISNIALAPEFRNRGLGKALIQEAVRQARQDGCERLILDVMASNTAAMRCYTKNGFAVTQKWPMIKMKENQFIFYRMALHTMPSKKEY